MSTSSENVLRVLLNETVSPNEAEQQHDFAHHTGGKYALTMRPSKGRSEKCIDIWTVPHHGRPDIVFTLRLSVVNGMHLSNSHELRKLDVKVVGQLLILLSEIMFDD